MLRSWITSTALLGIAACNPPAHVVLTVEDPHRQAVDAAAVAIGPSREKLTERELDHDFPARFTLVDDRQRTVARPIWVEARHADGSVLGVGLANVVFPASDSTEASVRLGAWCEREDTNRLPCVMPDDGADGICAGSTCSDPSTVSFCLDAGDCMEPGACEQQPAVCITGECVYTLDAPGTSCDDLDVCTQSDVCTANGECVGDRIACGETAGGCRQSVGCDPIGGCQYIDTADSTLCIRGSELGYCVTGACEECIAPEDCVNQLGDHPACVDTQCNANECVYLQVNGLECEAAFCSTGTLINARLCEGYYCVSQGYTDCSGRTCDASGPNCRSSCSSNDDCLPGLSCNSPDCDGLKDDDLACVANGECLNTCVNGLCTQPPTLRGQCDDAEDCTEAGQECFNCAAGSSGDCTDEAPLTECRLSFGTSCTANDECAGTCLAGVCLPHAVVGEPCDPGDDEDCLGVSLCTPIWNHCQNPIGEECSWWSHCNTGDCENNVCCAAPCGVCTDCDPSGSSCAIEPDDDPDCGSLDCSVLNQPCFTYAPIGDRCADLGVCKTLTDCVGAPVPGGVECRPAGLCDTSSDVCNGTDSFCPDRVPMDWLAGARCVDLLDVVPVAEDRGNIVAQDFVDCQAHCDAMPSVAACSLLGSSVAGPFVNCIACDTTALSLDNLGIYSAMYTVPCAQ